MDHRTKTLTIALAKYQDKKQEEIVQANTMRNKGEENVVELFSYIATCFYRLDLGAYVILTPRMCTGYKLPK